MVNYEQFSEIELRIATVLAGERLEGSDKLLRLQVSLGEEERQIIAGRIRGLWLQFLPGVGLLTGVWFFAFGLLRQNNSSTAIPDLWNVLWVVSSFVSVSVLAVA